MSLQESEQQIGRTPPGKLEQVLDMLSTRRARIAAAAIYASNALYHRFGQEQGVLTSTFHGITSVFNAPMYSPQFHDELSNFLYSGSQSLMYVAVGVSAANAVNFIISKESEVREGKHTIRGNNSVILAQADGLPLFVDLGQKLLEKGKLTNLVFSKTEPEPQRTAQEQAVFKVWVANAGGPERAFFDTRFWERSGAGKADAIVLNSSNLTPSLEAAIVIREQIQNRKADIIIITSENTKDEIDQRTLAKIVNPYKEVIRALLQGLLNTNEEVFVPLVHLGLTTVEQKRQQLKDKLTKLDKVKILLNGDLQGTEGKTLVAAFNALNAGLMLTDNPDEASVVLYFGNDNVLDDASVMEENPSDPFKDRSDVIRIRIPYARDNEDNALNHGDGTISLERATNDKLQEILEPKIKREMALQQRIATLFKRSSK